MGKIRKIAAMLCAAALVFSLGLTVQARELPNLNQKGSITVTMRFQGAAVGGGSLRLFRVGKIVQDDGNDVFRPTGDFFYCGLSYEDPQSPALVEALAKYAADNKCTPAATTEISQYGSAKFANLTPGLYMVMQDKAAPGYDSIMPFLVSLPTWSEDSNAYDYHVDASPKVELVPLPPAPETTPTRPKPKPNPDHLPQTGQMKWPVPVLAAAGMLLFAGGWYLYFGKREAHEE